MRKNIISIIVVVVILCLVAGLWFYKNIYNNKREPEDKNSDEYSMYINLKVQSEADIKTLKEAGLPIILNFSADWCSACNELKPILNEVILDVGDRALIKNIDVDDYGELANTYEVVYIPTQVFYNSDGTYRSTNVGVLQKDEIISMLKEMGMKDE